MKRRRNSGSIAKDADQRSLLPQSTSLTSFAGLYDAPEYSGEWSADSFTLPEYTHESTELRKKCRRIGNESAAGYDDEERRVDDGPSALEEAYVDVCDAYECGEDEVARFI